MSTFPELNRTLRGHDFYPPELDSIPPLYATEETPLPDKIVHTRYFVPGGTGTWFVMELDRSDDVQALAFGWADLGYGELGYFDLVALESTRVDLVGRPPVVVERDTNWTPRPWSEVSP